MYDPPNFSWPSGTHIAVVEIDTEIGEVDLIRYIAVDDVGKVINPTVVAGQIHGGIAQGVAQALCEEAVHDEDGNLVTGSMVNYLMPSAAELPSYELGADGHSEPDESARRQGRGGDGHDRLDRGRDERRRRRARPPRHHRPGHARDSRASLAGTRGGEDMIPAPFDYEVAESVEHAVELLGSREDAKLLAGGHSLIPLLRLRFARPALLVDLGRIDELRYVRDAGDTLAIGGLTRHHDLQHDPLVQEHAPVLSYTAGLIGDPQVRHRGTIGGSIAHGDPAADLPAVLTALDAEVVIRGPGRRANRAGRGVRHAASSTRCSGRRTC